MQYFQELGGEEDVGLLRTPYQLCQAIQAAKEPENLRTLASPESLYDVLHTLLGWKFDIVCRPQRKADFLV